MLHRIPNEVMLKISEKLLKRAQGGQFWGTKTFKGIVLCLGTSFRHLTRFT